MPISIVIQMPPGSLPGMMNFATAPTTRPMRAVQSRCSIAVPPYWFPGAAGDVSVSWGKHTPPAALFKSRACRDADVRLVTDRIISRNNGCANQFVELRKFTIQVGVTAFEQLVLMSGSHAAA